MKNYTTTDQERAVEVKAEYSHEDRVTLASCLSWDINEITPSDVKGILERLEIEGYRLVRSALVDVPAVEPEQRKFKLGDRVAKTKGSSWNGRVVGFYSTAMTQVGYAVESEREPGSVQIYPESALAATRSGSATSPKGGKS